MEPNVSIRAWMGGELVHEYEGHNIWVDVGKTHLAKLVVDPPLVSERIRFMGFGIGGIKQSNLLLANAPPVVTSYPGSNTYSSSYSFFPVIESLERPVRVTGGTAGAYPVGPPDVWLAQPPPFEFFTARGGDVGSLAPLPPVIPPAAPLPTYTPGADTGVITFKSRIDTNAGQLVYPPFTSIPLSEIGLFLSSADVNDPFNTGHLVAYHSFATIVIVVGMVLEFSWTVGFK